MQWLKNLIIKLIGKRLDGQLDKWHISKTKVVAVVSGLVAAYQGIAPTFGWPPIPDDTFKILAALGLWALKDGQNPVTTPPSIS